MIDYDKVINLLMEISERVSSMEARLDEYNGLLDEHILGVKVLDKRIKLLEDENIRSQTRLSLLLKIWAILATVISLVFGFLKFSK